MADASAPRSARPGTRGRPIDAILTDLHRRRRDFPTWSAGEWSAHLRRPATLAHLAPLLDDPEIRDLAGWVASRAAPGRELRALAGALAVVGDALHHLEVPASVWVERTAGRVDEVVRTARPERRRSPRRTRVAPSGHLEWETDTAGHPPAAPSRLSLLAAQLLRQAGFDLRADPVLARRLPAALDVAVAHWTAGTEAGQGLPAFPAEAALHSRKRLTALLGADRDLLYLVYGPQPGRGRPIEVARRRGLAYWTALALRAAYLGEPLPRVPPVVIAHWRLELSRLGGPGEAESAEAEDRSDAPSA